MTDLQKVEKAAIKAYGPKFGQNGQWYWRADVALNREQAATIMEKALGGSYNFFHAGLLLLGVFPPLSVLFFYEIPEECLFCAHQQFFLPDWDLSR